MNNWLTNHTKSSLFFVSLGIQSALHLPLLFLFSFCGCFEDTTYATLALISSLITSLPTVMLLVSYFDECSNKVTYLLPLSFIALYLLVSLINRSILESHYFIDLPYEWEKYPRIIGELYAFPFAFITLVAVAVTKLNNRKSK